MFIFVVSYPDLPAKHTAPFTTNYEMTQDRSVVKAGANGIIGGCFSSGEASL
jgi:hypothetical protein